MADTHTNMIVTIQNLQRELDEARAAQTRNANTAHRNLTRAEAAEARLAAGARVLRGPYIELTQRELVALLDEARAALTAPVEPKASTWCPDDASPSNPNLRGKP